MLVLALAAAAAASSPYLPSTPPGTYPFAHFTDELMRNTTWQDDVKHVVLVHGFARSGSTIVAKQLRDAVGGQDCWVGRTVAAEAQLAQDVYPAWDTAPENARNKAVCAATAWAAATSLEEKQAALYGLVQDRSTTARTLLSQWRVEGDVAVLGAPAHDRWPSREGKSRFAPQTRTCATWVAKDPRLDTLQFLPWLLKGVVRTTTVLVLRHPYASVYLSEFGGGPCKPSSLGGVVGQWLAAWRRVYGLVAADALAADATVMFRTEDLLLDEDRTRAALRDLVAPRRRRALLTIRGAERGFAVDASHAFVRLSKSDNFEHYAAHFTRLRDRGAWAARAWLFEHFGYDLRVPTNLDKCGACALDALPAGLLDTWPSWPRQIPTSGVTAEEYHCRRFMSGRTGGRHAGGSYRDVGNRVVRGRKRRPLPRGLYE